MLEPNELFELEKSVWTDADFDRMSWHDVTILALGRSLDYYNDREWYGNITLYLDIDYIFEWVNPDPPSQSFSYWIAPCSLVFFNACELSVNRLEMEYLEISSLSRKQIGTYDDQDLWQFQFNMHSGETISFNSTGFTQYTRMKPVRCARQTLNFKDRGDLSFDCLQSLP